MEIKYEAVFGPQELFNGTMDDCEFASEEYGYAFANGRLYYCERYNEKAEWSLSRKSHLTFKPSAMRRIIKEPKRWTWEDKKAGRLPELGALVCDPGNNVGSFVGAVIREGEPIFFLRYEADRCEFWLASACKPIETLDEKAQRERNEWAKKASEFIDDELDCVNLVGEHVMRRFYNAMLSGDLPVPVKG